MDITLTKRPYHFDVLRDQFVASGRPLKTLPSDWCVDEFGGWHLYRHPTTRMVPLVVGEREAGWLIGEPWEGNRLVQGSLVEPTEAALLERVDELGGPLVAIIPDRFVRHDAMGQQSLVFSPERRAVATNPLLLKEACGGDLDEELIALMDIPAEDRWYPFGLTPVMGVERLLPNHFLNLQTWEAVRYWPRLEDLEAGPVGVEMGVEIVRRCVREAVDAIASEYPIQLGLTAGYDSRVILACARKHALGLVASTNIMHPKTGTIDHHTARRLARIAGVSHEIRESHEATTEEKADFVDQTGLSAAGMRYRHIALMNAFGKERVLLYGHGSEVVRGNYHKRFAGGRLGLAGLRDAETTLSVLRLPLHPRLEQAHRQWVVDLPQCSDAAAVSLLYHEQRKGSWASVLRMSGTSRPVWVFSHRDLLRLMLRLPLGIQTSSTVLEGVIAAEWPELLQVPFNRPTRWRAAMAQIQSLAGKPQSFLGGLKQRLLS